MHPLRRRRVHDYPSLIMSDEFLATYADRKFGAADRSAIIRALERFDRDETHPSLRIHKMSGDKAGMWSLSVTSSIRIEFERVPDGRKRLRECSRHYDR